MPEHKGIHRYGRVIISQRGIICESGPCSYSDYLYRDFHYVELILEASLVSQMGNCTPVGCNLGYSRPLCVSTQHGIPAIVSLGASVQNGRPSVKTLLS